MISHLAKGSILGGGGSVLQGLVAICHEAVNDSHIGIYCPEQSVLFL
jgi:hypothetical protein